MAASVLEPVNPEHTATGSGLCDMIFRRKIMPSIGGISTSRRITSGVNFFIFSMAMSGSAPAVTWKRPLVERIAIRAWRTMAGVSRRLVVRWKRLPILRELFAFPRHYQ